jgi:multidrug efflux pump
VAHFFITRPIFAIVLSIVIVLLGGVAILVLPVAQFPPISPPLIQVQTTYIGASA